MALVHLRHEILVHVARLEVLHLLQAALDAVVGPLVVSFEEVQDPIETGFERNCSD